jgi:hypothetical protein
MANPTADQEAARQAEGEKQTRTGFAPHFERALPIPQTSILNSQSAIRNFP